MRGTSSRKPKIGVFFCTCKGSIGKNVDLNELESRVKENPDVVLCIRHDKLCEKDGQAFLKDQISNTDVDRIVLVGCTPRTYEEVINKGALEAGINRHLVEHVNIRELCEWIHPDEKSATEKAVFLVLGSIARVAFAQEVLDKQVILKNNNVLIIGGGIAGITSALELIKNEISVHLVEKTDKLGGRAYELDTQRLSEEDVILPNINELIKSDKFHVMLESEVVDVNGTLGDYKVKIASKDKEEELDVGAIVIATGSELFDAIRILEYKYDDADVIDFFELEKMLVKDEVKVPSSGEIPKRINFIQCVGSRDENKGNAHCSLVCCTYAIKQAAKIKILYPDTEVYIHYMDLRGPECGFEEYFLDAQKKGVNFIRGRVAEIQKDGKNLILRTEHIELGDIMSLPSDLVVLSVGQQASVETQKLADMVHLPLDKDGFLGYYNDRFEILDRRGISIAGCAQGPRGVARSISDAKKAVREIAGIMKKGFTARSIHSVIDETRCAGCRICEELCPYEAIYMKNVKDHVTEESRLISSVNLAVCQGCGACAMACPGGVPQLIGYSNKEILAQIDELI
ncbi:MAG: CoB--CoM heterodisulfide reductase iron-sulfur subunit A family protein [Thermoplasmata archaeon]|nr:MAG: CoB--CoM heterodisulfide reductase iron-sulfur subunit A family protein [Thermoplasmata archaeon]